MFTRWFRPVLLLLLAGCAAGQNGRPLEPDPPRAVRLVARLDDDPGPAPPAAAPWPGDLVLGAPGPVDPARAPLPATDAERVVFAHLYETLTTVTADGEVSPALAARWSSFGGGRRWELVLRQGTTFWDGTPLDAAAVASSWAASAFRAASRPAPPTPLAFLPTGPPGLRILDGRTLRLDLPEAMPELPAVLAHPALAVRGAIPSGGRWPRGSGPCRPGGPGAAGADTLVLLPNPMHPAAPTWRALKVVPATDASAADLVLTRDPDRAAALAQDRDRIRLPGPWDRLHLLICPPEALGATDEERQRWTTGWSGRELALDHSVQISRPPAGVWFLDPEGRICPLADQSVPVWDWPDFAWEERTVARDGDLILFPAGDPQAAALAAYLADHAARPLRPAEEGAARGPLTPPRSPVAGLEPQALGLPAAEFEAALQAGRAGAYVLPVARGDASACRMLAAVIGRALWLQEAASSPAHSGAPLPEGARPRVPLAITDVPEVQTRALRLERGKVVLPLTVSRLDAVARRGLGGLVWRHDGVILLNGVGRTR